MARDVPPTDFADKNLLQQADQFMQDQGLRVPLVSTRQPDGSYEPLRLKFDGPTNTSTAPSSQPAAPPGGLRQNFTTAQPTTGNVEDALGRRMDGSYAPGGYRIIERPGEAPLLTNVTGVPDTSGGQFVRDDTTGETALVSPGGQVEGYTGGLRPQAPAPAAPTAPAQAQATATPQPVQAPRSVEQVLRSFDFTPTNAAGARAALQLAGTLSANETSLANRQENLLQRDRMFGLREAQTDISQQNADAATANARIAGLRARADFADAQRGDQPKVSMVEVQDPNDPLRTQYYLAEDGVITPTRIDPSDPVQAYALRAYNLARQNGENIPFDQFLRDAEQLMATRTPTETQ